MNKLIYFDPFMEHMTLELPGRHKKEGRAVKRNRLRKEAIVQPGIAFPSARDQEHLLIVRLDITGALFIEHANNPRKIVQNGLRRLCVLFEQIYNGKKRIDQLDDHGIIVSQNVAKEFEFSATIGFGASFFEQLGIPQDKRPRNLREMPGHTVLGDIAPYSLGQTDMIIQLGSTKDFVNRWVLENNIQTDEDELLEKLLKKQKDDKLSHTIHKKILKELSSDTTPVGVKLREGERCCPDGQILSSAEEECVPDIMSAIQGWATVTDIHAGFQRIDGRNLMGFNDGVSNPKPGDIFDKIVWTTQEDEAEELKGGTYMVFQKIEHDLDQWRGLSLDEQEEWVGRSKGTGLLLGTLEEEEDKRLALNLRSSMVDVRAAAAHDIKKLLKDQMKPEKRFFDENREDYEVQGRHKKYRVSPKRIRQKVPAWSHVRKANPRQEDGAESIVIFRRGYPFVETGLNNRIRSGLLFVCFQKNIQKGFEVIKKNFLNNKNFPVPSHRGFTPDELKDRHKNGRFSITELRNLTYDQKKVLGLDEEEEFNEALEEAGIIKPEIDNNLAYVDIDKKDLSIVADTQNTGREGLAGPSEHGVTPTGEFLATVTYGGGYYFVPPIPNRRAADIGQQFFD
jgi:Dyp-type peroxidase family